MNKKFDGVVLVSDMDGTYIAKTDKGARRNREAIEYFKSRGGRFTFATGRNLGRLLDAEPDAKEIANMPVITCNGASIYDIATKAEISSHILDKKYVTEMKDIVGAFDDSIAFRGATRDKFFYYKLSNSIIDREYGRISDELKEYLPINQWDDPIYKITLRGDDAILSRLYPILKERFSGILEIVKSDFALIDVHSAGVTKAAGIREAVRYALDDEKMFLCVAGDYDNDLEMMSIADMPCCPQNAAPKVLELCKSHFCHCNDGLIGDVVEHLDTLF